MTTRKPETPSLNLMTLRSLAGSESRWSQPGSTPDARAARAAMAVMAARAETDATTEEEDPVPPTASVSTAAKQVTGKHSRKLTEEHGKAAFGEARQFDRLDEGRNIEANNQPNHHIFDQRAITALSN